MGEITILKRSFLFLVTAAVLFVLAGCSNETAQHNEQYVSQVKELVNQTVNYTRVMVTKEKNFNCHNEAEAKEYIDTLDKLSDIFQKVITLNASEEFDQLNKELSQETTSALSEISELKSLAAYAIEKGDDTFYQRDKAGIRKDYDEHYRRMTELSSEIQTQWRND